jgi:D-alanyl-lipoteichoic acid acyltransferase DltB (MBOAT superfamily)
VLFPSVSFLFYFLPLFFVLYCLTPGVAAKNLVLLAASLLFYAWGEPRFVLLLIAQIVLNYAAAILIDGVQGGYRRLATATSIALNLSLLAIFKYADFAVEALNAVTGPGGAFALPGIALPLGISFFTFHAISYLIDVHRGAAANRNPLSVAVYIAMFPQLVAGPIVRYHTVAKRLSTRRMTLGRASAGMRIFAIGLAQKVLVADEVSRLADAVFDKAAQPGAAEAWLGLAAYTIQIYFDFAGYSNMAIGLALALGFAFPRNFRLPYTARSIAEFWRRWHISLSQWLRDYLYVPLGGSRGSLAETYRNLCLVFVLCGLWHGAKWTFVIWGIHHGAFLIAERAGLASLLVRAPAWLARLYALLAVMSGWVWFRASDFEHALAFFAALGGARGWSGLSTSVHLVAQPMTLLVLLAGALLALVRLDAPSRTRSLLPAASRHWFVALADTGGIALCLVLSVLSVAAGSYSPFLYFRF